MRNFYLPLFLMCVTFNVISVYSRYVCFTGSSLYQQETQDCGDKDPKYNGTWYCSKVEVCEAYIPSVRQCIVSRGCAKEEQCVDSSGAVVGSQQIKISGNNPGGKPHCPLDNMFVLIL